MNRRSFVPGLALGAALLASNLAWADVAPDPPTITITSPMDGATFDGPTASIDVTVNVDPGEGGVERVDLLVDGVSVASSMMDPYDFMAVEVQEGMHTLTAVAISAYDQSENPSQDVSIVVFGEAGGSDTGGSDTGDPGTGGSDDNGDGNGDGGGRCAAVPRDHLGGGGALMILGLLGLGLTRRRREH